MICLQGGAEFGADCVAMDATLVDEAARRRSGPVVVAPLAARPGREHDIAGANGVRHFAALGADALVAPDARHDAAAAADAWRHAALLVLPGGSPSRLLDALRTTGLERVLTQLLDDGVVVMGASAGAMVLCARTWLPDRGGVVDGLGHVPQHLVLPHWDGRRRVPPDAGPEVAGLGIPEQSGVLVQQGVPTTSVGRTPSRVLAPDGTTRELPRPAAF
jgi:cyanophycinase-like exopeptidase